LFVLRATQPTNQLKNSKFMNFVQKIGAGEVTFDDTNAGAAAGDWAEEFGSAAAMAPGAAAAQGWDTAWGEAHAATADPLGSAWSDAVHGPRQDDYQAWADAFGATEGGDWAQQFEQFGEVRAWLCVLKARRLISCFRRLYDAL
jgi:hypothetical protein